AREHGGGSGPGRRIRGDAQLAGRDTGVRRFRRAHGRNAMTTNGVRALVVDDEPRARQFLEKLLGELDDIQVVGTARGGVEALARALDTPGMKRQLAPLTRLPVRHRREIRLLDLAQVPLIFSRDRLVLASCEGHEYLVDYTLQELEQRLPEGQFVRVHRAALVNVGAIESYGGEDGVLVLKLKDGARVEASERRAAEVRRRLR